MTHRRRLISLIVLALPACLSVWAGEARAQDPRLEAARKEGKVVWYTSLALTSSEKVAKLFETAYPGVPTSRTWTWSTPPTPATTCC